MDSIEHRPNLGGSFSKSKELLYLLVRFLHLFIIKTKKKFIFGKILEFFSICDEKPLEERPKYGLHF